MKLESSKLVRLLITCHEKFGRYVSAQPLRLVDAGALAPILQHSLATNVPLSKTGSDSTFPIEFSPRGCIVDDNPEKTTPTNLPSGE